VSRGFPGLEELLPHGARMRLLSRVVAHAPTHTTCAVDAGGGAPFRRPDGSLPGWVGLELMAQCAAAHGGLASRVRGEAPRPGLFLGSRRARFYVDAFRADQALHVTARHRRGELGLVAFDCEVRDAADERRLAEARLNVYVFRDWQALEESVA
jgi:predicted hotdog family 3-hydroxylacyl-ACP dehydratase